MNKFFINKRYLFIFFIIFAICGCSTVPDMVSTEKKKGEKYSADEVRYLTIDQPFMTSGDYFRERNQDTVIDPAKFFSKSQTENINTVPQKETPLKTAKRADIVPEKPELKDVQPKPISLAVPFPVKIGVLIDRDNISADSASIIYQSISKSVGDLPVIIAEREMIEEALTQTRCPKQKDLKCLSQSLGIYPGIRMMVLVEKYIIPAQFPGTLTSVIGVADTGLGFTYPFMEIKVPVNAKSDLDVIMPGIMRNILDFASRKSKIMPWFCRAFSHENNAKSGLNKWYVTAGAQSGLKPGDILKVVSESKFVKSPAGMPAGWVPGIEKGRLKVQKLFAKDFAVCTLESGTGPDKGDLLLTP